MPQPFDNLTPAQIMSAVQNDCVAFRNAVYKLLQRQAWLAQYAQDDLTAAGMTANSVSMIFEAVADGNGAALLMITGTDPRNVDPGYVYMRTINAVAGPYS